MPAHRGRGGTASGGLSTWIRLVLGSQAVPQVLPLQTVGPEHPIRDVPEHSPSYSLGINSWKWSSEAKEEAHLVPTGSLILRVSLATLALEAVGVGTLCPGGMTHFTHCLSLVLGGVGSQRASALEVGCVRRGGEWGEGPGGGSQCPGPVGSGTQAVHSWLLRLKNPAVATCCSALPCIPDPTSPPGAGGAVAGVGGGVRC